MTGSCVAVLEDTSTDQVESQSGGTQATDVAVSVSAVESSRKPLSGISVRDPGTRRVNV